MMWLERLLLIHDSQIRRWGGINGRLSLFGGMALIITAPVLHVLGAEALGKLGAELTELGERIDPELGQALGRSFDHLGTVLAGMTVLFALLGLTLVTSAILILKLHRRLREENE